MTSDELARLHAASFTAPRPWSAAEFDTLLASPPVFLVHVPLGFALGRVIADQAEVLTVAVAPDARRRGIARHLMAAFEVEAARRGAATAFLEVASRNAPARALYTGLGYRQSGLRRGYFPDKDGPADDALILSKPLAP